MTILTAVGVRLRSMARLGAALLLLPLSLLPLVFGVPLIAHEYEHLAQQSSLAAMGGARLVADAAYATDLPVLRFHTVGDPSAGAAMSSSRFAEYMAQLKRAGFHPVTVGDYERVITGRLTQLPPKAVLVTFDLRPGGPGADAERILAQYRLPTDRFRALALPATYLRRDVRWKELIARGRAESVSAQALERERRADAARTRHAQIIHNRRLRVRRAAAAHRRALRAAANRPPVVTTPPPRRVVVAPPPRVVVAPPVPKPKPTPGGTFDDSGSTFDSSG